MVNRGEEKVWVQMNVVPRSTGNTNSGTRELTLKCKLKCYFKPMNNPLGVSPSKGKLIEVTCFFFKLTVDQVLVFDWIAGSCQVNLDENRAGMFGSWLTQAQD